MDRALKQRLVGASVLIILTVIVLPMLLSGRSDTLKQESRQIEMPPKPEELSIESRRFPVGLPNKPSAVNSQKTEVQDSPPTREVDAGVVAGGVEERTGVSVSSDSTAGESTLVSADPAVDGDTESVAKTPVKPATVTSITLSSGRDKGVDPESAAQPSPDSPRYLVQVASFSSEKNANLLASRLRQDKLPVLMDVVDRTAGRMHRVRVGPYAERSEADKVVTSLKTNMKELDPRVLDLRPAESAPVSSPSDPLVRWVVQVGSFGSDQTAESLVAELRLAGYTAFSEKVSSAGGTAYKVRIGPELDRDKAVELARKVKAERQLDGFVTTQE